MKKHKDDTKGSNMLGLSIYPIGCTLPKQNKPKTETKRYIHKKNTIERNISECKVVRNG